MSTFPSTTTANCSPVPSSSKSTEIGNRSAHSEIRVNKAVEQFEELRRLEEEELVLTNEGWKIKVGFLEDELEKAQEYLEDVQTKLKTAEKTTTEKVNALALTNSQLENQLLQAKSKVVELQEQLDEKAQQLQQKRSQWTNNVENLRKMRESFDQTINNLHELHKLEVDKLKSLISEQNATISIAKITLKKFYSKLNEKQNDLQTTQANLRNKESEVSSLLDELQKREELIAKQEKGKTESTQLLRQRQRIDEQKQKLSQGENSSGKLKEELKGAKKIIFDDQCSGSGAFPIISEGESNLGSECHGELRSTTTTQKMKNETSNETTISDKIGTVEAARSPKRKVSGPDQSKPGPKKVKLDVDKSTTEKHHPENHQVQQQPASSTSSTTEKAVCSSSSQGNQRLQHSEVMANGAKKFKCRCKSTFHTKAGLLFHLLSKKLQPSKCTQTS